MFTIKREQDFKNPEEDITRKALPRYWQKRYS